MIKNIFVKNEYQKYKNVNGYHINNADRFLDLMKERVSKNDYVLCGSDSCKGITALYNECFKVATTEQHEDFILITSETEFDLVNANEQLKNKFVFYSPKIIYGVDFNNFDVPQDVFIFIKGMTISPSESFQQVCRTRHIKKLYFHGSERDKTVPFKTLEQTKQHFKESVHLSKKLDIISSYHNEKDEKKVIENTFFNIFTRNEFIKSVYKSNKLRHFKNILTSFGFVVIEDNDQYKNFSKKIKQQMNEELITESNEKMKDLLMIQTNQSLNILILTNERKF